MTIELCDAYLLVSKEKHVFSSEKYVQSYRGI